MDKHNISVSPVTDNNPIIIANNLNSSKKNISIVQVNEKNNFFYLLFENSRDNYDCKQHIINSRKTELINMSFINYCEPQATQKPNIVTNCCLNIATIAADLDSISKSEIEIINNATKSINFSELPIDFSIIMIACNLCSTLYSWFNQTNVTKIEQQNNKKNYEDYKFLTSLLINSTILTFIKSGVELLYHKFVAEYYYQTNTRSLTDYHDFVIELRKNEQFKINSPFSDINLARVFYAVKQAINCRADKFGNLYKALNLALVEQWILQNQLGNDEAQDTLTSIIQKIIVIILYDNNFTKELFHYDKESLIDKKHIDYVIATARDENDKITEYQQKIKIEKADTPNADYLATMKSGFYSVLGANSILYITNIKGHETIYKLYNPLLKIEATTKSAVSLDKFFKKIANNIVFKKLTD